MYALFAESRDHVNVSCCSVVPPVEACCTKELSRPTCHAWYPLVFVVMKFHVLLPTPLASTSVMLACTVGLGLTSAIPRPPSPLICAPRHYGARPKRTRVPPRNGRQGRDTTQGKAPLHRTNRRKLLRAVSATGP